MERVVFLLTDDMEESRCIEVENICRAEGFRVQRFDLKNQPYPQEESPALIVGGLSNGSRSIPQAMHDLASRSHLRTPLLLLCQDTLVQDAVSIHNGRLTLIGKPLTEEKIAGRIRTIICGNTAPSTHLTTAGFRIREFRGPRWWAAVLSRHKAEVAGQFVAQNQSEMGFGVVLAENASPQAEREVALRSAFDEIRVAEQGAKLHFNGMYFSLDQCKWRFQSRADVSSPGINSFLFSAQRMPPAWAFDRDKPSLTALAASSGDVAFCWRTLGSEGAENPIENFRNLTPVCEKGGPALLEWLQTSLGENGVEFESVIVEVR